MEECCFCKRINKLIKLQTDIAKKNNSISEVLKKVYGSELYEKKIKQLNKMISKEK